MMTRPGPHPHRDGGLLCPACRAARLLGWPERLACPSCGHEEPVATASAPAAHHGPPADPCKPDPALAGEDPDVVRGLSMAKARAAIARRRVAGTPTRRRPTNPNPGEQP